jgi:hypothetical protein
MYQGSSASTPRMPSSGNNTSDNSYGGGYGSHSGAQTASASNAGLSRPNTESSSASASQKFERRPSGYTRQSEELHLTQDYSSMGQATSRERPGSNTYSSYSSAQESTRGQQGQQLPGALQPGNSGRPQAPSSNTAPSTVPVLPSIATQSQSYNNPSRPSTDSHSHAYSRSSPAAPYVNTPDTSKFASPPSHKYTTSQSNSYSPLGLSDIRDSGDGPTSANPYGNDGATATATNCNYLAPWAVYAFDWCKWPVQQQGLGDSAGKMAIGSYLEDGHNYVSWDIQGALYSVTDRSTDTNIRYPNSARSRARLNSRRTTVWHRIHKSRRGNALLSRHSNTMGTRILYEEILQSSRNIRRPSTIMDPPRRKSLHQQLHHPLLEYQRTTSPKTHPSRSPLKLQVP